jgi:hypothetical protein
MMLRYYPGICLEEPGKTTHIRAPPSSGVPPIRSLPLLSLSSPHPVLSPPASCSSFYSAPSLLYGLFRPLMSSVQRLCQHCFHGGGGRVLPRKVFQSIYIKASRTGWLAGFVCVLLGNGRQLLCSGGVFFGVRSGAQQWGGLFFRGPVGVFIGVRSGAVAWQSRPTIAGFEIL